MIFFFPLSLFFLAPLFGSVLDVSLDMITEELITRKPTVTQAFPQSKIY